MPYKGNPLHYATMKEIKELNQKKRDIEIRYLITLLNRINLFCSNNELNPPAQDIGFGKGKDVLLLEMYEYMYSTKWKRNSLGCSRIVDNSYFEITSLDLQTRYRMELSDENHEIILSLLDENYTRDRFHQNEIELFRVQYSEYKKAIDLMEQIDSIVREERQRKANLQRLKYEINNPRLCEIAKSTINAACISHKKDHVFIWAVCSDYQGYILISPDGVKLYVMFIVLKNSEKQIQKILDFCAAPEPFLSEEKNIECFPICSRNVNFDELRKIDSICRLYQIVEVIFFNKPLIVY